MKLRRQNGFTLIEVIIAMALFSLFLIATIGSYAALTAIYGHGIALRRATDNSRVLIQDVTKTAQYADKATVGNAGFPTSTSPMAPVVSPASNTQCGPELDLYTATSPTTPQYVFEIKDTAQRPGDYGNDPFAMDFFNYGLATNFENQVTQNDGTSFDFSQNNANGITKSYTYTSGSTTSTVSVAGAYIFCVYNDGVHTPYVRMSFTMNNNSTIKSPSLFFNVDTTGANKGINYTTTIGIGGAGS